MPITYKRRRAMRTTRRVKRRVARPNRARVSKVNVKQQLHFFTRRFAGPQVVGNAAYSPYLFAKSFDFNSLPNVSDFSNLFDRYMITYAKVSLYLKIDPSAQTSAAATFPKVYMIRDYDDATTPTSLNQLREHGNCKVRVMNPNRPVTFGIRPATLALTLWNGVTPTGTPTWKQWIDMVTLDVPHFGVKWAIDDLTNTNYKVDVEYQLWFRCKDVR